MNLESQKSTPASKLTRGLIRIDFTDVPSSRRFRFFPGRLKEKKQWVCYGANKVPINPNTSKPASTTDPSTWSSFPDALLHSPKVGFVFSSGDKIVGIDLDKCRDPATGSIEAWAKQIIQEFNSYTEVSVSGRGIHIFVQGTLQGKRRRAGHIEVYDSKRYFVVTGDRISRVGGIRRADHALARLEKRLDVGTPVEERDGKEEQPKDASASGHDWSLIAEVHKVTGVNDADDLEAAVRKRHSRHFEQRDKKKGQRDGVSYTRYTVQKYLQKELGSSDWRKQFRSRSELNQKPLSYVVTGFIPEEGITGIGGLSGHAKTWVMLSLAKTIHRGGFLWKQFRTEQYPILYLIPESGDRSFRQRMEMLDIPDCENFLVRTMSQGPTLPLTDPALREAGKGRVVFLDTLPRFTEGKDEQQAKDMAALGEILLGLLQAGAIAVVFAHHSPKNSRKEDAMDLENVFRGSGDIGAIMAAGHGIRMINPEKTLIQVECVKARDFEPRKPFQLEGRPSIEETGDFRMVKKPGQCGSLAGETRKKADGDLSAKILRVIKEHPGISGNKICHQLGGNRNNVYRLLNEGDQWKKRKEGNTDKYYSV